MPSISLIEGPAEARSPFPALYVDCPLNRTRRSSHFGQTLSVIASETTTPLYASLLVVHVIVVLIGLVQLFVAAKENEALRRVSTLQDLSETTLRYFARPSPIFGRVLLLVPITGAGLLGASNGRIAFSEMWVLLGALCWFGAFAGLEAGVFANERRVALGLAEQRIDQPAAAAAARAAQLVAAVVVLAALIMIFQPGG